MYIHISFFTRYIFNSTSNINKDEKEFDISFFFPSFDAELFLKENENVSKFLRSNGKFLLKDFLFPYFFLSRCGLFSPFNSLSCLYLRIILFLFTFLSFVLRIISLYRRIIYFVTSSIPISRIFLLKKFLRLHHVRVPSPTFLPHLFHNILSKSFQKSFTFTLFNSFFHRKK